MTKTTSPNNHFNQARASLQQAISWYGSFRRHWHYPPSEELQTAVKTDLQAIKGALDKLDRNAIAISTFGLVSSGKSSVINAIVGEEVLETGPLHGVTKSPQSFRWSPPNGSVDIELIDTPGLDEVQGEARAKMAREVAQRSDLILFVVAGDITRTEYEALRQLRRSQKPLILIFNKIDLYPYKDRETIYRQLQQHNAVEQDVSDLVASNDILMVAAKPQKIKVRIEAADGTITDTWETPPPQIDELKQKIIDVLAKEGRSLLALNSLVQARDAEQNIARKTLTIRQQEAQNIIWKYATYKAIAVAANPVVLLDLLGGVVADLALIRALARLYGLPLTSYEASNLLRRILASSGALLFAEIGSGIIGIILGVGKTGAAITGAFESSSAFVAYTGAASLQAAIAWYGSFIIGRVAQVYLEQGCTWGALGPSTVIADILNEVEPNTIIYRLRQELLKP